MSNDTIAAVATAPGRGSVGIVRISGPNAFQIGQAISQIDSPKIRYAHYGPFFDDQKKPIDEGLTLFFKSPHSFTGEDIVEFQGHGGLVVMDMLLKQTVILGARLAQAGEFSQRAFLNDKMDLTQAEAIADLIDASSERGVKQAVASLQGGFSERIDELNTQIIKLRMFVEAAIDFPEEEIDFLSDPTVENQINNILLAFNKIGQAANQGRILQEGIKVVIAGRPNAGKSSLLNALADQDIAIVTDIQGTTRDILRESIHIDGMPITLIDTAGLRDTDNQVEKIGISKAWQEIDSSDLILLVVDATDMSQSPPQNHWPEFYSSQLADKLITVYNKCDLNTDIPKNPLDNYVSALTTMGLTSLKNNIKKKAGVEQTSESLISARRRHLDALAKAEDCVIRGKNLLQGNSAGELLAEELRLAQDSLGEITGKYTPDDLLGTIFSSFCIGK